MLRTTALIISALTTNVLGMQIQSSHSGHGNGSNQSGISHSNQHASHLAQADLEKKDKKIFKSAHDGSSHTNDDDGDSSIFEDPCLAIINDITAPGNFIVDAENLTWVCPSSFTCAGNFIVDVDICSCVCP